MMKYLAAHPIDFQQEQLQVTLHACTTCQVCHGADHIITVVTGEAGSRLENFGTPADALNYLLHVSAELASNGRPHAWELAHTVTTWVLMATTGTQVQQVGRLN